jgi:hypothetical protein
MADPTAPVFGSQVAPTMLAGQQLAQSAAVLGGQRAPTSSGLPQAVGTGGGPVSVSTGALWRIVEIPIRGRTINDADGVPTDFSLGDGKIYHFADPALADAWKFEARRLVNDTARLAQLNAPLDRNNKTLKYAQLAYVFEITRALAEYYNACGIVWWNDPVARRLYRKWISGPPDKSNGADAMREQFGQRTPYAKWTHGNRVLEWWESNEEYPYAGPSRGAIVRGARDKFLRHYPRPTDAPKHPLKFAQSCGLWVSSTSVNESYIVARDVINRPFALMGFGATCGMAPREVDGYKREVLVKCQGLAFDKAFDGVGKEFDKPYTGAGIGPLEIVGQNDAFVWDDWRSTYFDVEPDILSNEINTTSPLKIAAPLRDYLPWLKEWVDALGGRPPQATILDSRTFVAWQNIKSADLVGGVEAYIRQLGAKEPEIQAMRNATDPGLQTAAVSVAALGAASASLTAGWGALIGGAAAATITLVDMVTPGTVRDFKKDDLGRFKPIIERAQTSGDPTRNTKPGYNVPSPPGFVRTAEDVQRAAARSPILDLIEGQTPPPAPPPAPGATPGNVPPDQASSSTAAYVVGGALAAVGALLLLNQGK